MTDPAGSPRHLAWGVTAAVILAGGLAFYLARDALAARIAALPDLGSPREEELAVEDVAPAVLAADPEAAEPNGPQLTYGEVEAMLAPLPARVLELIAEGRRELPEYRDLGSGDETKASRSRRFFRTWATTWNNRLGVLERDTPPREECAAHAALEPACAMLAEVYAALRAVPAVARVEDGEELLDQARQAVEDFLKPPQEDEPSDEETAAESASP